MSPLRAAPSPSGRAARLLCARLLSHVTPVCQPGRIPPRLLCSLQLSGRPEIGAEGPGGEGLKATIHPGLCLAARASLKQGVEDRADEDDAEYDDEGAGVFSQTCPLPLCCSWTLDAKSHLCWASPVCARQAAGFS